MVDVVLGVVVVVDQDVFDVLGYGESYGYIFVMLKGSLGLLVGWRLLISFFSQLFFVWVGVVMICFFYWC